MLSSNKVKNLVIGDAGIRFINDTMSTDQEFGRVSSDFPLTVRSLWNLA